MGDEILAQNEAQSGAALFVLNTLMIGGSERKTVRIANELKKRGCDIHVAYLSSPTTLLEELSDSVPVVDLERRGKLSFKSVKILRKYIQRHSIRKVVCVNLYPLIYARLVCTILAPEQRPETLALVNSTEHIELKEQFKMLLYSPLLRWAGSNVFGCNAQKDLWVSRYNLDVEKCSVIYNGVDTEKFFPESSNSARDRSIEALFAIGDFVIGTVGQLRPEKNQAELLSVLAELKDRIPNAKLLLVGNGSEKNSLLEQANSACISDRLVLLGQVNDVRPALSRMDLFVLPSISETFSNATLEAMAMGKAVILSDTGGAREMTRNENAGFVYQQGDITGLSNLIEKLAREFETIESVGQAARQAVNQVFSFKRMVDRYQELLF